MGKAFHVDHQIANKNVEDSVTEWTRVVKYSDINSENRLFGGTLMSWIDEVAGTVAVRHSGNPVATAAVDNMQFKQGAKLDDIIVMIGKITHVGKTSMEVRVDTYVEDRRNGMRHVLNRAYLTEVCIDTDDTPVLVPYGLNVKTESERAEWEGAEKRIALRKQRRMEGF
ncbi:MULTISPECIES: acyl-CoA thioesterase [Lachnospiraceae]|uniref:acyl-CoA thioesterase n=1 Tax=Lachnospiraceae TaxID=186803 RepID=UPI0008F2A9A4|nr:MULTISPECIES: acyl-CoA thioesterase [Lachnospiraceae]SFU99422.1 Acyl-CoA hydrolase [Butyrivibrio sp. INlla21]